MYLYLILALQGFCIYHSLVNRNPYYWIFIILFLPALGSILYLFLNVFQKQDIEKVQEGFISVVNPTRKIIDLENKLKFSESFENKVALADAYLEAKQYDQAIDLYRSSLKGTFEKDFYANSSLIEALFYTDQFAAVIARVEGIKDASSFKKSKAAFLYALALEKTGNIALAESYLSQFNAPYSSYQERLELSKFHIRNRQIEKARSILGEIAMESERMSKMTYRLYKKYILKAKALLDTL